MKLKFLGTAQDGGIPQAGCTCRNCVGVSRMAASIALIADDKSVILIDATPDFRCQSQLWGSGRLKAVYLTHAHWGHYGGLMQFGKEGWNVKGLPLYLSEKFYNFLKSNEPFNSLFEMGNLLPKIIVPGYPTDDGIIGVPVDHRGEFSDTFAYSFDLNNQAALYLPDVDSYDLQVENLVEKSDLVILDGTFFNAEELPGRDLTKIPHPFIQHTAERAVSMANKIIFTHFNHSNPMLDSHDSRRLKLEVMGFRFASEGDILE